MLSFKNILNNKTKTINNNSNNIMLIMKKAQLELYHKAEITNLYLEVPQVSEASIMFKELSWVNENIQLWKKL